MRTLNNIIIAERDPRPEKIGSIYLPGDYDKQEEVGVYYGCVKVAGPDCRELKAGDRIMYHRSNYVPLVHEGKDFAVFHEDVVLAKLDN